MTTEIRRVMMRIAFDRSLARWMALAVAVAAALTINAPIGGGNGA